MKQKKELVFRVVDFSLIDRHLYKMSLDEILHEYFPEHERNSVLVEAHGGVTGGHYTGKATMHKILRVGLWWPIVHKDSKEYCSACDVCQRIRRPSRSDELPLNPQVTLKDFDKWMLEFVGPVNPSGKKIGTHYIITTKDYLTRWAEAQPVKDCNVKTTVHFIFEYILSRFGCPMILMSDIGTHFFNCMIEALTNEFKVHHQKSMYYHP